MIRLNPAPGYKPVNANGLQQLPMKWCKYEKVIPVDQDDNHLVIMATTFSWTETSVY